MPAPLSPQAAIPIPYYPALDGVRAWCVLLVMINHIHANGFLSSRYLQGHRGVDIFFVLSGFLITLLLRQEQQATHRIDFAAFYARRGFRIIPVYLVVLLLYIAVCQLPSQHQHWLELKSGLPWFLTFNNEFAHELNAGTVFTHTWSLGIEEKFYLIWPALFFLLASTLRRRTFLFILLFTAVLTAAVLQSHQQHAYLHAEDYFGLLIGALMAVVLSSAHAPRILARVGRIPTLLSLALLLLGFVLYADTGSVVTGFSVLTALFLTHLIARPTSWLATLHATRPMVWLGKRSYSMYLIHILCINALAGRLPIRSHLSALIFLSLAYALTALGAALLYLSVEQPCRRAGRAFLKRRHIAASPQAGLS